MEFTSQMQDKLLDTRFAFERDLVRKKGRTAFTLCGIITECVICGDDFDRIRSNEITCSPQCKQVRHAERQSNYRSRNRERINESRRVRPPERPEEPWTNLMVSVLEQAKADGCNKYLDLFGEMYTEAILGRSLDG